ncbi:glycosyltransferase family 2 protein [Microbacterium sp. 18062]|uniref:glycosyltransferase family 2 protein n=1 Tax=Microbacterium sp. 18062 TaxID=2681410 RepID=UPI00135A651F|nr:glycosyltransferase family 2 protein [Microbacterium sp. 18062]
MTDAPKVSIVMRTKDRPDFLRRALRSISSQMFSAWEAVVVNDGGNPDTVDQIVQELAADVRTRLTVRHHDTSRGRWQSANAGVLATSAPFLVLHDDDDTWDPGFLEAAVEYLEEHHDRDAVVSRIRVLWEQRTPTGFETARTEIFQPQLHDLLLSDALLFNRYVPIGFVYRRALHEELGLYRDTLPVIGDWEFNLRVLTRGPIEFLGDRPLVNWHQREGDNGSDGNSVIEARGDHARYDALLRDEQLRTYVGENGLGLVLYLTKFIDQRFVEVENGIRTEIARSSLWRRLATRLRRR